MNAPGGRFTETGSEVTEVFRCGGATLILGDAKTLADAYAGQADLILTDPPYKLTAGGKPKPDANGFKRMSGMFSGETYDNSGLLMAVPSWGEIADIITRVAGPNAEAYVMANDKNVFDAKQELDAHGWKLHNLLIWDTLHPKPNRWYMKHMEYVLYMWQGKARGINNKGSKQLFAARRGKEETKVHDTQKPIALLSHYVLNSTDPGDLVIDPYAGSGSTLIAAAQAGRRAVGFEVCPTNFKAACDNIRTHLAQSQTGSSSAEA